jgi:hypothetical protein
LSECARCQICYFRRMVVLCGGFVYTMFMFVWVCVFVHVRVRVCASARVVCVVVRVISLWLPEQ